MISTSTGSNLGYRTTDSPEDIFDGSQTPETDANENGIALFSDYLNRLNKDLDTYHSHSSEGETSPFPFGATEDVEAAEDILRVPDVDDIDGANDIFDGFGATRAPSDSWGEALDSMVTFPMPMDPDERFGGLLLHEEAGMEFLGDVEVKQNDKPAGAEASTSARRPKRKQRSAPAPGTSGRSRRRGTKKKIEPIPIPSVDEMMAVFDREIRRGQTLKNPWKVDRKDVRIYCNYLREQVVMYRSKHATKNPRKGALIAAASNLAFGKNLYIRGSGLKPGMASSVLQEIFHFACQSKRYTRNCQPRKKSSSPGAPRTATATPPTPDTDGGGGGGGGDSPLTPERGRLPSVEQVQHTQPAPGTNFDGKDGGAASGGSLIEESQVDRPTKRARRARRGGGSVGVVANVHPVCLVLAAPILFLCVITMGTLSRHPAHHPDPSGTSAAAPHVAQALRVVVDASSKAPQLSGAVSSFGQPPRTLRGGAASSHSGEDAVDPAAMKGPTHAGTNAAAVAPSHDDNTRQKRRGRKMRFKNQEIVSSTYSGVPVATEASMSPHAPALSSAQHHHLANAVASAPAMVASLLFPPGLTTAAEGSNVTDAPHSSALSMTSESSVAGGLPDLSLQNLPAPEH